jgi:hypothetical protein
MTQSTFNPNSAMNTMMMSNHIMNHFNGMSNSNNTFYENITDTKFASQTFLMFIQIFAVSLFSAFSSQLSDGMSYFRNIIDRFIRRFIFGYLINPVLNIYSKVYKFIRGIKPKYRIELVVSLITSESKKNGELFEIIQWFISSQFCEKKKKPDNLNNSKEIYYPLNSYNSLYNYVESDTKIPFNITPLLNEDFIIIFENHEITCIREKNQIELNGDLESQKRDNISYYLETYDENENSDILERFCNFAVKSYNTDRKEWKQKIFTNNEDIWDEPQEIFSPNNVDSIILREGIKEDFVTSLDFFFKKKDFYKKHGQRHKYVTLLLGPPGTGKTTLVTAYANQNRRHIYSLNMKKSFEGDLKNLIDEMDTKEGDLLIDDFDHYFSNLGKEPTETEEKNSTDSDEDDNDSRHRKNSKKVKKEEKRKMISYHELLTVLDGTGSKEGLNIYICVNDPSKIFKSMNIEDLALVRERRVNKIIKFDYCDHKMIKGIYQNIFNSEPNMDLINMIKEDYFAPCVISQQFISFLETNGGNIDGKQKEIDKILLDLANDNIKTNQEKIMEYIDTLKKYNKQ